MIAIKYTADGISMTGYLADGAQGKRAPGILVAHEALGVNDPVKARAQALADMGHVAFALDLYGEANIQLETARTRHAELMATPARSSGARTQRFKCWPLTKASTPTASPRSASAKGE